MRCNALDRVHIGLDFFDASINRIAAWVIGARNVRKALLRALLDPIEVFRKSEDQFDFTRRLAAMEEQKSMPWPAVWEFYCVSQNIPYNLEWMNTVQQYEHSEFGHRND